MTDATDSQLERWRTDVLDTILHKVAKIDVLVEAQKTQGAVLEKMSDAMSKLALVEERQNVSKEAMERAFRAIERTESRLDALEMAAPANAQTSQWVSNAMWAAASFAVYIVVNKLGLM